jgi:hypothetical protein
MAFVTVGCQNGVIAVMLDITIEYLISTQAIGKEVLQTTTI